MFIQLIKLAYIVPCGSFWDLVYVGRFIWGFGIVTRFKTNDFVTTSTTCMLHPYLNFKQNWSGISSRRRPILNTVLTLGARNNQQQPLDYFSRDKLERKTNTNYCRYLDYSIIMVKLNYSIVPFLKVISGNQINLIWVQIPFTICLRE